MLGTKAEAVVPVRTLLLMCALASVCICVWQRPVSGLLEGRLRLHSAQTHSTNTTCWALQSGLGTHPSPADTPTPHPRLLRRPIIYSTHFSFSAASSHLYLSLSVTHTDSFFSDRFPCYFSVYSLDFMLGRWDN